MSYKKFSAPQLFDGYQMLQNFILITDEKGVVENIVSPEEAGDDVLKLQGILCPGFINCHCHLELSHMKGLIPEKTGLVDFVFSVVTQRHFALEEIEAAIDNAENEMLQNGIVAVGDICNTAHTTNQKKEGNLTYYNFIEVSGWLPEVAQTRLERALNIYDSFRQQSTADGQQPIAIENHKSQIINHKSALVPHAPYSVSEKLWLLLQPYFTNKTVSIHNQETSFEDELFIQGGGDFMRMYNLMKMDASFFSPSGRSSLQTYFSKLKTAQNVMLVHNTFTKEADVLYAKEQALLNNQNLFWCLCVNANLYIEDAVPPVEMLIKNHVNLVLGTDSLASNQSLNLLDEIKTLKRHFSFLTTEQLLRFATSNGAKALTVDEEFGSFKKGKQPGVLLLSEDLNEVKRLI